MISSVSLESSPVNSQEEELQMLHSLLLTEKWLFLELLGYYRIFLCWAFLLFRNKRSCSLVTMKAILSSLKLFFGTKLCHCAQKLLRCFPLIPVLWNQAWIVLGHNMELQNPASSFKYHHLFYIRNMWLLNRQLIPSTDTRFCLPHLLSHSSIAAAQKTVTKTSMAPASIWVSKSLPFRGGTGVCRPTEVWHFSPMSSLCYTQEKEHSLCPRQVEKWLLTPLKYGSTFFYC